MLRPDERGRRRGPSADRRCPRAGAARRRQRCRRRAARHSGFVRLRAEEREKYWIGDRVLGEGDVFRDPEMAQTLERLGAEGAAPFYTGDIAAAAVARVAAGGGLLTAADLAAYEAVPREPTRVGYRG